MDGFYEEDERIVGHAADSYHRIDIRQTSRHLIVHSGEQLIAASTGPLVLCESGFATRWYVPPADVNEAALTPVEGQTFCPYKGLCSYCDIEDAQGAAWSYRDVWPEVRRISGPLSFEPDKVSVTLDGTRLRLDPGQNVIPHGVDRHLDVDEIPAQRAMTGRIGLAETALVAERESNMPSLLSLNVGMPRDVSWQGRTVHTGVWKHPVQGPRMARKLNIDGDGQGDLAGHGGEQRAVFVYQIESYRYWEEYLGRKDFTYGQFGENFTVEGLPDEEVCIGDHYRIGDALFEVTQPRVTCYRVGIRMGEPRMPALLVSHRRSGFYFRVLQEGEVQAGDTIVKVATGPEAMTVVEIDGLLYLPRHPRRSLTRALRIPALSEGWRGSFQALLDQDPSVSGNEALNPAAGPPVAWSGLRRFTVVGIDRESATVISIRLGPSDEAVAPSARPGQFLTIRLQPGPDSAPLLRSYSLSGPPDSGGYRISVKREVEGAASGYLHTRLRVGDTLEIGAPRGNFVLVASDRPVVLVSAGVGATPVLAMLHALVHEGTSREVWWVHSTRNLREHSFAEEVNRLLATLPDAHRLVCYSRPGADDRTGRDFDVAGHLNAEVLDQAGVPTDADFYLCGPGSFMHDLGAALVARGITPDRVRTEIFGPSDSITPGVVGSTAKTPHPPDGPPGAGPTISFSRSNLAVPWNPAFSSLLELAEACDVPVRWSCRTGVCHTCESGLVSGQVEYRPDPLEEPGEGDVLICCSQPQSDVALDM